MLGFNALGRLVLGTAFWTGTVPPVTQSTPVNADWQGIDGIGYCASITYVLVTQNNGTAAGVTLQINSFDVMYEKGGLM